MSDRIEELRELDNTAGFGNPYLTEALDGWEKAEAELTRLRGALEVIGDPAKCPLADHGKGMQISWELHMECVGELVERALTQENPE